MEPREVYDLFYPGTTRDGNSIWKEELKYCSKKEFFETESEAG